MRHFSGLLRENAGHAYEKDSANEWLYASVLSQDTTKRCFGAEDFIHTSTTQTSTCDRTPSARPSTSVCKVNYTVGQ